MSTAVALQVGESWPQPRPDGPQPTGTEQCQAVGPWPLATMGMRSEPTHTKPVRKVLSSEKNNPNNLLIPTKKHNLGYLKRLCERVTYSKGVHWVWPLSSLEDSALRWKCWESLASKNLPFNLTNIYLLPSCIVFQWKWTYSLNLFLSFSCLIPAPMGEKYGHFFALHILQKVLPSLPTICH